MYGKRVFEVLWKFVKKDLVAFMEYKASRVKHLLSAFKAYLSSFKLIFITFLAA